MSGVFQPGVVFQRGVFQMGGTTRVSTVVLTRVTSETVRMTITSVSDAPVIRHPGSAL